MLLFPKGLAVEHGDERKRAPDKAPDRNGEQDLQDPVHQQIR
jgi:hypothetical protein